MKYIDFRAHFLPKAAPLRPQKPNREEDIKRVAVHFFSVYPEALWLLFFIFLIHDLRQVVISSSFGIYGATRDRL